MSRAEIVLEIPTETYYLSSIRNLTHAFARRAGFAEQVADQIQLAVDEVCAAACPRGDEGDPEERRLRLELGHDPRKLWVRVSYRGERQPLLFDDSGFGHPPLADEGEHDMGHVIVSAYMDEVDFAETEEGTEVRLVRFLRARSGSGRTP